MKGKTGIIIGVIVVILLAGGGIFFLSANKNQSIPGTPVSQTTQGGNLFTSIKDALSKSLTLECNFTDEDGRQTKSYVKNGAIRADFTAGKPEDSGSVIIRDKKMYMWNGSQGFMLEIPDEKDSSNGTAPNKGLTQEQEVMQEMEKYKEFCKPGIVSDSLFTPPQNVKFQNFSSMMQPQTGTTSGNPPVDQNQIQDYMKQFGVPDDASGVEE